MMKESFSPQLRKGGFGLSNQNGQCRRGMLVMPVELEWANKRYAPDLTNRSLRESAVAIMLSPIDPLPHLQV
jgi:hypothetical protein